jgi:hypothetical protein
MEAIETVTAEGFAKRFGMVESGPDNWTGSAGPYEDGYSWASNRQAEGLPWLIEAEGWPYVIISRGSNFLVWYVEGDLRLTRYGLDTDHGIDLDTAVRMYDRADLEGLTEAERFEVIQQEDDRDEETVRGIVAAWMDHNGGKWEGGPDWDDYANAILPIDFELEAEEHFADEAHELYKEYTDKLPDGIVIDWKATGRDLGRAVRHGGVWFDQNRLDSLS